MNGLDIALVVVLIAFALYGAVKGFVRLLLGSIALATGIFLGCWYNAPVAGLLSGLITSEPVRRFTALVLILVATIAAFAVIVWFVTKTLEVVHLRWIDRVTGAAAGLALACVLAALLLVPLAAWLPADSPMMNGSALGPYVLKASAFVKGLVPQEIRQRFDESTAKMKETGKDLLDKAGRTAQSAAAATAARAQSAASAAKPAAAANAQSQGKAPSNSKDPNGATGPKS